MHRASVHVLGGGDEIKGIGRELHVACMGGEESWLGNLKEREHFAGRLRQDDNIKMDKITWMEQC
jgi:hypothetical protein